MLNYLCAHCIMMSKGMSSFPFMFCSHFSVTVLQMKLSPEMEDFFCDWCLLFFSEGIKKTQELQSVLHRRVGKKGLHAAGVEGRRRGWSKMGKDLIGIVAAGAEKEGLGEEWEDSEER